ncbi:hypothetical protein ANAPC2_01454 [Anaplasma phagocytophilum]|nr:hypothetical protein ANAPC2_01454 [Anaplasma phagocytophilum]
MSWDHGTFQPWMNVTASFVRFGVPGCPHLDLGLNKTTVGSVFGCLASFPFPMALT